MAVALYRRYRSQRFGDLVGQEVIATTLRNEVRDGKLAHAYLFAGIRGTGKTSTARILARAVNCQAGDQGEPCNECEACKEINSGVAVDVLEIDAASNRGIDEMRDLREKVKYLPASLRRKVYIIDEAHMLTTEAWNAFLKTLEEPPAHVLFILATTEPHKVPETVRSRVQRFDFRRVSPGDIEGHLRAIIQAEKFEVEDDAVALLAHAAQGSVRDALSMLDQALAGQTGRLTLEHLRRALGLADPQSLRQVAAAMASGDAAAAMQATAAILELGVDPRQLLRGLNATARSAAFVGVGYGEGLSKTEVNLARELSTAAPLSFWLDALELLSSTEINLRQPVDARTQVEYCVLRLAQKRTRPEAEFSSPPPVALPAAPVTAAPVTAPIPEVASTPAAASVPSAAAAGVTLSSVPAWQASWSRLIDLVNRRDAMLAGVLRDCSPIEASPNKLVVGAAFEFHLTQLQNPAKNQILLTAVEELAGGPRELEAVFAGKKPSAETSPPGTAGELTQKILDTFAGSRVTATRLRDRSQEP